MRRAAERASPALIPRRRDSTDVTHDELPQERFTLVAPRWIAVRIDTPLLRKAELCGGHGTYLQVRTGRVICADRHQVLSGGRGIIGLLRRDAIFRRKKTRAIRWD